MTAGGGDELARQEKVTKVFKLHPPVAAYLVQYQTAQNQPQLRARPGRPVDNYRMALVPVSDYIYGADIRQFNSVALLHTVCIVV